MHGGDVDSQNNDIRFDVLHHKDMRNIPFTVSLTSKRYISE